MKQKELCFRYTGPVHDDVAILGLRFVPKAKYQFGQASLLQHFTPAQRVFDLRYKGRWQIEISALHAFRYETDLDLIDAVVVEALSAKKREQTEKTIRTYLYAFNQSHWDEVKAVDSPLWREAVFGRPIAARPDPQVTSSAVPPLPDSPYTQVRKPRSNSTLGWWLLIVLIALSLFTQPWWMRKVLELEGAVAALQNLSWCEHGCAAREQAWCQWWPVRAFIDTNQVRYYVSQDHPAYSDVVDDKRSYAGDLWFCCAAQAEAQGYIRRP
jgi:hypothetical protein